MDSHLGLPLAFAGVSTSQDPGNEPSPPHGASARPAVAKEVQLSFWLWTAGAVLLVLSSVLLMAQRDTLIDVFRERFAGQGFTEEQVRAAVTLLITTSTIVSVALAGLAVFFAAKARAGRSWARIALTLVAVASFFYVLLFQLSVLGLLVLLVVAAAVVTLYLPGAKGYFDSVKRSG